MLPNEKISVMPEQPSLFPEDDANAPDPIDVDIFVGRIAAAAAGQNYGQPAKLSPIMEDIGYRNDGGATTKLPPVSTPKRPGRKRQSRAPIEGPATDMRSDMNVEGDPAHRSYKQMRADQAEGSGGIPDNQRAIIEAIHKHAINRRRGIQ